MQNRKFSNFRFLKSLFKIFTLIIALISPIPAFHPLCLTVAVLFLYFVTVLGLTVEYQDKIKRKVSEGELPQNLKQEIG